MMHSQSFMLPDEFLQHSEKLKQELDQMTSLGVMKRVEELTEWGNSMVCVKKPKGGLRVCMDPKDLHDNIKRKHSQIPTRDEITSGIRAIRRGSETLCYTCGRQG